MKYCSLIALCFVCVGLKLCLGAVDSGLLKTYDDKVCKNEPTCNLTANPGLSANRLTFDGRDCMCDFECVEYNDCCKDSDYYKAPSLSGTEKSYYCSPDAKVYMVTSCLPTYPDEEVKMQCSKGALPLTENNKILIIPVTNKQKRVTYANAYCALCNEDTDFEVWSLTSGCGEAPAGYLSSISTTSQNPANSPQNKISSSDASKTTKTDNSVKVQVHFNPGSLLGKNKSEEGGINKEIKIPTFGLGGAINKTIGSSTSLFGLKIGRSKRDSKLNLDFNKYAEQLDQILQTVHYDLVAKEFVGRYDNKDFICRFGSKIPSKYDGYVRKCLPNLISECPGNSEATKLCQSYTAVVYDKSNKQPYRNKDCAICNGVAADKLTGCPQLIRTGAAGLFSTDTKAAGGAACSNPDIAAKFC